MKRLTAIKHKVLALFCASAIASFQAIAEERIVDTQTGRQLSRTELLQIVASSDYLLLGELHDNPLHHVVRGKLLASLPRTTKVVAEHLEYGRPLADHGPLLPALESAGFSAENWRWPLHGPLFSSIRDHGLVVLGGNIPKTTARAIVREGLGAIPPDLAAIHAANELATTQVAKLDAELLRSHCGQVPANLIPGLRLAQQVRDAAMFDELRRSQGKPAVLLAGNGHVRKDYGVPRFIARAYPQLRQISIAFLEEGASAAAEKSVYDYLWITDAATRNDPCVDFGRAKS